MAFWGIEVKPGKPFTHSFDRGRGRLRISQATLGIGSAAKKSIVQCNVGDKSPVFLCALLPDKTESCHLDVEFEEADDVLFSVIGPRSVHLTGYYLGVGRHANLNDDTDSYGEDIGNTETDASTHCSEEDDYEDSFIDDGNPDVVPPSPVSNDRVVDEEMLENSKPKGRKNIHKRLKKKYQSIESDDDINSWKNDVVIEPKGLSGLESEDEDNFPISSIYRSGKTEAGEKVDRETSKTVNKMTEDHRSLARTEDEGTHVIDQKNQADAVVVLGEPERVSGLPNHSLLPSSEVGFENNTKSKKKRKRTKEGLTPVSDGPKDHKVLQDKAEEQKPATDKEIDQMLPSNEAGSENGAKPKKRRKELAAEGTNVEGSANCNNVLKEDTAKQNEVGSDKSGDIHPGGSEQEQKLSNIVSIDVDSNQVADRDQDEDKKTKKKKKKSKSQDNEGNVDIEVPLLPLEEKNRDRNGFEDKKVEANLSQARTLSNGLIIEELEMGKPDGKIAAPGKKIKVHYVGKLRENGRSFDSNVGKAPFKFRLGAEDVIDGWNTGLDGMRVGGKRKLIIPPLMGYGSQGVGENIPPNSWLVYEIELVGVH